MKNISVTLAPLTAFTLILLLGAGCTFQNSANIPPTPEKNMMEENAQVQPTMEDTKMKENIEVSPTTEDTKIESANMMKKQDVMKTDEMKEDEKKIVTTPGSYEDYAPSKLTLAQKGKVILFFKASWCPTCQAVDTDILAHVTNIPKDTYILKVDYDTSTELKRKYGVTYQHTFVQVDAQGNQIKKWSGSPTLESVVSQVQ